MSKNDNSTNLREMLEEISAENNPLVKMLMVAMRELMEAEVSERLRAEKSERNEERTGYRSGYRKCDFDTMLGTMELEVPKLRQGGYVPFFKKRRQRCDDALILAVQDMYISGISTRKTAKLIEDLGIKNISAGEISEISKRLDAEVQAFRERPLESAYPILWVDALYENVRVEGRKVSTAVEVVCGVNQEGQREVLAIEPMAEESRDSYLLMFRKLQERGLKTPKLVISDAHPGLVSAIREGFPGATWQRCKVHFMRNILAHIPQTSKERIGAELKQIWLQPSREMAEQTAKRFIEKHAKNYPEAVKCLQNGLEDSLSFYAYPSVDSKKIASSNMIERLNEEIRRRTKVVGTFPNIASYVRLATAHLMEYSEEWSSGRVYISKSALEAM